MKEWCPPSERRVANVEMSLIDGREIVQNLRVWNVHVNAPDGIRRVKNSSQIFINRGNNSHMTRSNITRAYNQSKRSRSHPAASVCDQQIVPNLRWLDTTSYINCATIS
jgi:hypothetical protein